MSVLFKIMLFISVFLSFYSPLRSEEIIPVPVNPGIPLNSTGNDFAPSVSPDGNFMVFNSRLHGQKYQDIYISEYKNGKWNRPRPIYGINSPHNDETPHIFHKGQIIIFSSDRDGSIAIRDIHGNVRISYDLYWSRKTPSGWTKPVHVPGGVNTANHERAPSLSPDEKTLYYTTWPFGRSNMTTIMMSNFYEYGFGKGQRMPFPINSDYRDMALIQDSEGFYFSSSRPGGFGGMDIFFVSYKNGKLGKAINLGPPVNSKANDLYYSKNLDSAYFCSNRQGGYGLFDIYSASFSISSIYFDYDSAKLKNRSYSVLDSIADFLKKNKNLRFRITGHTDLHGTDEYNLKLSLDRARAVKNYFVSKGLSPERFSVKGAGKNEPVINDKNADADKKNRRTEFRVLRPSD